MNSYAKTFAKVLPATSAAASLLGCGDAALTAIAVAAATAATAESTSSFTTIFDVALAAASAASSLPNSSPDLVALVAASAAVTATVTATFSLTPPLAVIPPTHRQAARSIPSYSVAFNSCKGSMSTSGGDGFAGGGGERISIDVFGRHDNLKLYCHGGRSYGCPENAGAAGTYCDAIPRRLIVSNNNLSTTTHTLLLDFPNHPLWTNVYIEDRARACLPLLWTRVQVSKTDLHKPISHI